jgi:Fis family transcriptional regulator, factor for inversion stimulation protein
MLPRCWLLRRSEQLEHNQCHGLFICTVLPLCCPLVVRSRRSHSSALRSVRRRLTMKEQLESVVLQMYKAGVGCSDAVREFQKAFILTVLKAHRGNQCKAAEKLGMHRNTLRRTIRELQIDIGSTRVSGRRRPPRSEVPTLPVQRRAT